MPVMPSGTVTFLFTDIEGSTKRWEAHPQAMRAAFSRQEAILRQAVATNGGYAYKVIGTVLQSAFPTAPQALQAALHAQRMLQAEEWAPEVGTLWVRMALHTGVMQPRGNDYFGPILNRLSRLLSAAHGGQTLLTSTTAQLVQDALPEGIAFKDLGEHSLHDLIQPEHIFQAISPDLPSDFPPLKTLEGGHHNLPVQPTTLVGREQEVEAITEMLGRNDVQLLTLTGPGGIGKTRLAIQVGAELLDQFKDGVFFVPLESINDQALVMSGIAHTLGVRETAGRDVADNLHEYLRDKQLLLVIDNFEQVVEAAPSIFELLASSPQLKTIVTSRAPLNLSMEHQYQVPPLSLPDPSHLPPIEDLRHYEAVELFIERARAANHTFEVNDQNASSVAAICARLDGLPLAIELAAARSKILSPESLLARLDQSLKLLVGGARDLPTRQQTLRSTIEWSHDLLAEGEKQLFRRISIFQGGAALEAIEVVCGGTDGEAPLQIDALDGVGLLVNQSLLQQREDALGEARFWLLQSIQEYAHEKLVEAGEKQAVGDAHAAYYIGLVEKAEPELIGADQGLWLERLAAEHDNVRSTHDWLVSRRETEQALRLSGSLTRFWLRRGYLSEARRQFVADLARSSPDTTLERAKALHGVGIMAFEQGDHAQAKAYYEEAASMRKELGDMAGLSASLNNLANVALYKEEYQLASTYYEQALDILRGLDNKWGIAMTLGNMGWVGLCLGDYSLALSLYEESLHIHRAIDDRWGIANSLGNMAWAAAYQGDYSLALGLTQEAIPLFESLGDKDSISDMLDIQGRVAVGQGDYAGAHRLFAESIQVSRELGDKPGVALLLLGYASLAAAEGQFERSAKLFGAADALRDSTAGFQRFYYNRHLKDAHAHLDPSSWEQAWQEGQAMSMEQAVTYALEDVKP